MLHWKSDHLPLNKFLKTDDTQQYCQQLGDGNRKTLKLSLFILQEKTMSLTDTLSRLIDIDPGHWVYNQS